MRLEECRIGTCDFMDYIGSIIFGIFLLNILDKAYGYFFIDAFPKQLCNEDKYLIMRKQFRIWDYIM